MSEVDFKTQLDFKTGHVNKILAGVLDSHTDIQGQIMAAMRYSLESPGKRLRAVLVLMCCELASGKTNPDADTAACAIEMVHTYSLIHDDLPAMDNDDFRRGRPSCHKQFGEATAILAGDALLTMAFELLSSRITRQDMAVKLISILAKAAGAAGMIAGQMGDMEAQNRKGDLKMLEYIHQHKTAKMFEAACSMGAITAGANKEQLEKLGQFGLKLGLCFQIADDILDVLASSKDLGKTAGKDAAQGKLTYPSLIGLEKSKYHARELTQEALAELTGFGNEANVLRQLAQTLLERTK